MVTSTELKGLTGASLQNSDRCTDKKALTKAFVDSQKRHATVYAIEGKNEFSRWPKNSGMELYKSTDETKADPAQAGFSSPVLQPRNAKCPSVVQQCNSKPGSDEKNARKGEDVARNTTRSDAQTKTEKAMRKPGKKSMPRASKEDSGKDGERLPHVYGQKRRGYSTSDEEREERLAQRRERRQRKREIVNPKACDEAEVSSAGGAQDKQGLSTKNRSNRNVRNKLPAGLALMHGFSADNIGKRRLTMGPRASTGVFSKGRASTKAQVQRKSVMKAPAIFNELEFLSKAAATAKDYRVSTRAAHSVDSDAASVEGKDSPRRRRKDSHHKPIVIDASSSHSRGVTGRLSVVSSIAKRSSDEELSNYESQIWEIEKEFLQEVAEGSVEHSSLTKPSSIVIDSKRWDWGRFEASRCVDHLQNNCNSIVDDGPKNELPVKSCSSSQSILTITPSQSASQVVLRPPSQPDLRTKSRFFSVTEKRNDLDDTLAEKQSTSSFEREVASHVPSHRQGKSPDKADELANTAEKTSPLSKVKGYKGNSDLSCFLRATMQELETEIPLTFANGVDHRAFPAPLSSKFTFVDEHGPADAARLSLLGTVSCARSHSSPHKSEMVFDHTNISEQDCTYLLCCENGENWNACEQISSQRVTKPGVDLQEGVTCGNFGFEYLNDISFDCDIGCDEDILYDSDFDGEIDYDRDHDGELTIQAREQAPLLSEDYNYVTHSQTYMGHHFRDDESESWPDVQGESIKSDGSVAWYGDVHMDERSEDSAEDNSRSYEDPNSAGPESIFNMSQRTFIPSLGPISTTTTEPLDSLKEAENAVAKAFKKNFHPIRF